MNEFGGHYFKWSKPGVERQIHAVFVFLHIPTYSYIGSIKVEPTEVESIMAVTKGWISRNPERFSSI
jgi:hypothetical protein